MNDTPRSTPAFALKPGWLHDDVQLAAERVAQGFPTAREKRLEAALDRIAFCGAGEDYRVLRDIARKALETPALSQQPQT